MSPTAARRPHTIELTVQEIGRLIDLVNTNKHAASYALQVMSFAAHAGITVEEMEREIADMRREIASEEEA